MIFRSHGLFWRRDEIDWFPGAGHRGIFRLLGRRGANRGNIRIANFREQRGIYILYGNLGPHYVGLARDRSLGFRLKDHTHDIHDNKWTQFSWFGFCSVRDMRDDNGFQLLRAMPHANYSRLRTAIGDIEALLIKSMALGNVAQMNFADDGAKKPWVQIKRDEVEKYCSRLDA